MKYNTIIFDLGGVFVDWNPRHFYKNIFATNEEMEYFLEHICTNDWNENQDAGNDSKEATEALVKRHPKYEKFIRMYYSNWEKMLNGTDKEMEKLLKKLKSNPSLRIYALTNWSHEYFPRALELFDFLQMFEGIVVSGVEKTRKPHKEIYEIILNRYNITPTQAIFIDDNKRNLVTSAELGIKSLHFTSHINLEEDLKQLGIL